MGTHQIGLNETNLMGVQKKLRCVIYAKNSKLSQIIILITHFS